MRGKGRDPFPGKIHHLGIRWEFEASIVDNSVVYPDLQNHSARKREEERERTKALPVSHSESKRIPEILMVEEKA